MSCYIARVYEFTVYLWGFWCIWFGKCHAMELRPNILFILADDMGHNDIGYNNPEVITPNLNRLASKGLKLESMYTLPLCGPSRAALLTGRYPFKIGMQHRILLIGDKKPMPLDVKTFPELLQQANYSTHLIGKWNLGDCSKKGLPQNRGFDTFTGFLGGEVDHYTREAGYGLKQTPKVYDFWNGTDLLFFPSIKNVYTEEYFKQQAVSLIRNAKYSAKPFYILYSSSLPHAPIKAQPNYIEKYDSRIDITRRTYLGMISNLDNSVGEIVDELESQHLLDNTIVIFMSDNGGMANTFPLPPWSGFYGSNYPLRSSKGSLFEGGIRVPSFILHPDLRTQATTKEMFHVTDWMPTLLSWAGIRTDSLGLDGVDQRGLLSDDSIKSAREEFVVNILDQTIGPPLFSNSSAAIRWKNFKLITGVAVIEEFLQPDKLITDQWNQPDEWRVAGIDKPRINGTSCGNRGDKRAYYLFNLEDDPYETTDVSIQYSDVVENLMERLEVYKNQRVDPVNNERIFQTDFSEVTDAEGNLKPGYCD